MSHKLFWKLCIILGAVCMALVYYISEFSVYVERKFSLIDPGHKAQLQSYQAEANALLNAGEENALQLWLANLREEESTFAAIVSINIEIIGDPHEEEIIVVRGGRNIEYPIHLHHSNPRIALPLDKPGHSLVLRLPDSMMPGQYWPFIHKLLHLVAPALLMVLVSVVLYRHVMAPLGKLEQMTRQFSNGNYNTRLLPALNGRDDEIGRLAVTFDSMADCVGSLIQNQNHLINDLSHELRTPLQRIELCLAAERSSLPSRLHHETKLMRKLIEDTLTLAWLDNEQPNLRTDTLDLCDLIEAIADDCRFEFPDQHLVLELPEQLAIHNTSERALNQALENILRNALRHTPAGGRVCVTLFAQDKLYHLTIEDEGPGVPDAMLTMIFKPFFRVDASRDRNAGGFGLGLALAKRQIEGTGGQIQADNLPNTGLRMNIQLPVRA